MPLVGLNSADFLVDGHKFHLLEINPRPGASFDLFELQDVPQSTSLFALHVDACGGSLPAQAPRYRDVMAGAIVYAERDIAAAPALDWPDWVSDRPVAGSRIEANQPLCSVFARAATAAEARALVEQRSAKIYALLREPVS
jgi:predicted ATP-grasp superfamily ATP-dependent carboligase